MKYFVMLVIILALPVCAEPTNPIRVSGTGSTFEQAKAIAFNNAIEIAVGSALLSNTETKNDDLIKQEIVKYSAGYVDDYKIITQYKTDTRMTLVMDVYVRQSKISERLLGNNKNSVTVDTEKLNAQYQTYNNMKKDGIEFVKQVLNDYPDRAYNVTITNVETKVDVDRKPTIIVSWKLESNYNYIVALQEALNAISDKRDKEINQKAVIVKVTKPGDFFSRGTGYYFNDHTTYNAVADRMLKTIIVGVYFLDKDDNILHKNCEDALNSNISPYEWNEANALIIRSGWNNTSWGTSVFSMDQEFGSEFLKKFNKVVIQPEISATQGYLTPVCIENNYRPRK